MTRPAEIVVISGKGGTGKTSVLAGFAEFSDDAVFCDCDVDAANLGLVLSPRPGEAHEFVASKKAFLNLDRCTGCGLCESLCRFGAARQGAIDPLKCEGCGLCGRACPSGAIEMRPVLSGHWFVSDTDKGPLVHARLGPGEENSGKLVTQVRQEARRIAKTLGRSTILTDGPPGIGCPVIASLSGAQAAVAVTEPSLSGIHDLDRVAQVCDRFGVRVLTIINKHDVHEGNTRKIEEWAGERGVRVIARIPYDENVPKTMAAGMPVTRLRTPASEGIAQAWLRLKEIVPIS